MGYRLCTAEKPSVASDIARVIGATKRCNGYFEGNGYRVTWAVGHLVTLAEPELYGHEYKDRNNISLLPIIPQEWKFSLIEDVKDQFYIIKNLMHDKDCEMIIDCGDMGETGHYLQWLIRMYANCNKPVKRFCATSMTDEQIIESMNNLRDIEDFTGIIKGALCKAKGDWVVGMSFSRLFSSKYHCNLTVGRVQTPTLYFVVKRWLDVNDFKSKDFYNIEVQFEESFKAWFTKDTENIIEDIHKDDENRICDFLTANKLANNISEERLGGGTGKIIKLETVNKYIDRPQLYDITELERDGNRIFGYTAAEVLEVAQSLYEKHKVITYPRTDSRYITSDLEPYMKTRVQEISSIPQYSQVAKAVLKLGLNIDSKIVNDKEVTDHHALVVTEKISNFNFSILNDKEKNILNLVITRMLVSFSPKYLYKESEVLVRLSYNGFIVGAKGRIPVSLGWKSVQSYLNQGNTEDESENEDNQLFQNLSLGQVVSINNCSVIAKKTTPPKYHTEATLLTAMENAGSSISDNEGYKKILKGHGIGTQATRAEIIKKLFDVGYITNSKKGKVNYLIPTKKGINAVKIFPQELLSPTLTAEWETKISKVANGTITENEFMNEFSEFMIKTTNKYKEIDVQNLDFNNKEELGTCLWCGSPVVSGKFKDKETGSNIVNYYCSNKECKFSVFKDDKFFVKRTKKSVSNDIIKKLLNNKYVDVQCENNNGINYTTRFSIVKLDSGFAGWNAEFIESKKKKTKRSF